MKIVLVCLSVLCVMAGCAESEQDHPPAEPETSPEAQAPVDTETPEDAEPPAEVNAPAEAQAPVEAQDPPAIVEQAIEQPTTRAGAVVYEGFEYEDGGYDEPQSQSGSGVGWGESRWSATKNGIDHVLPGLTYGSLTQAGGTCTSVTSLWSDARRSVGTTLSDAGLMADGATLWFSVVVDNSAAGPTQKTGFFLGSDGFSRTSDESGVNGGGNGIGLFSRNGGTFLAGAFANGRAPGTDTGVSANSGPVLLVGQITWGTDGGNETLTIYTPNADLARGAAVRTTSFADMDQSTFNTVAVRLKENSVLDEIRFGASYNDVVGLLDPEAE